MPSSEVNWASVPGLRAAAVRIELEARNFERVVADLYVKVNNSVVNPETFGDDKGGREFFAKWDNDFRAWDDGVRTFSGSVLATANGVDAMADAVDRTNEITTQMASDFGNYTGGNGGFDSGGGGVNIPPLPTPDSDNNGDGNTGGHNGRR